MQAKIVVGRTTTTRKVEIETEALHLRAKVLALKARRVEKALGRLPKELKRRMELTFLQRPEQKAAVNLQPEKKTDLREQNGLLGSAKKAKIVENGMYLYAFFTRKENAELVIYVFIFTEIPQMPPKLLVTLKQSRSLRIARKICKMVLRWLQYSSKIHLRTKLSASCRWNVKAAV